MRRPSLKERRMTKTEHIELHKKLHKSLDCLLADFLTETSCQEKLQDTSIMRLTTWSYQQTIDPTDKSELITDG